MSGEVELDGKVLVLKRIHAHYRLRAQDSHRETIERVHEMHAEYCPVARSLRAAIAIRTSWELLPLED